MTGAGGAGGTTGGAVSQGSGGTSTGTAGTAGTAGDGETPGSAGAVGSGGAQGATSGGGGPGDVGGAGTAGAGNISGTSGLGGSGATAGSGSAGSSAAGATGTGGAAGAAGAPGILAAKPYMGWSSWSSQEASINETKVKAIADVIASKLATFGYQYVNIDDGWYNGFDTYGRWKPNTGKFPDGITGTAAYVHSKGLKLGVYLTPGVNDSVVAANSPIEGTTYHVKDIVTSAAGSTDGAAGATSRKIDFTKPGAVEYVQGYANLLASWGVDFIKMDFVGPKSGQTAPDNQEDVKQWRAALDKSGRQIWLELSNLLSINAINTWKTYSNGWRVANDVECYCTGALTNWAHVVRVINAVPPFAQYAGPGHWNDLDSLEIGAGSGDGITAIERQTAFSFWAISAAPLYIGADLTNLDAADQAILTNNEVIGVDQAGVAGKAVST